MGESSLDFELIVWVGADATDFPAPFDAAYKRKNHDELVVADIEIPFPQRDLHVRRGALGVQVSKNAQRAPE